jgi:hypothetical protein
MRNGWNQNERHEYALIAREFLKKNKVYRYNLKKIQDMSDDEVIQKCHKWYEVNHMRDEYFAFQEEWFANNRDNQQNRETL